VLSQPQCVRTAGAPRISLTTVLNGVGKQTIRQASTWYPPQTLIPAPNTEHRTLQTARQPTPALLPWSQLSPCVQVQPSLSGRGAYTTRPRADCWPAVSSLLPTYPSTTVPVASPVVSRHCGSRHCSRFGHPSERSVRAASLQARRGTTETRRGKYLPIGVGSHQCSVHSGQVAGLLASPPDPLRSRSISTRSPATR
jgi:hypothetical protein